jgi:hypothetical protein
MQHPIFFFWALSREPYRLVLFVSTASVAAFFRNGCGSFRRPPATRTHRFPTPTPHVGQATEYFSFAVSCFILIVASVVLECCGSAVVVPKAGAIPLCLRFLDGHRAIFQERDDQFTIYLQASVVADQALPLEFVHEFTYPWAGGTNHLRQG